MKFPFIEALAIGTLLACRTVAFAAEPATFSVKMLTPETALKAAQAALTKCRKDGFQTAVAVVDRAGVVQVPLGPLSTRFRA